MIVKRVSICGLIAAAAFAIPAVFVPESAQAISYGARQADGMVCRVAFRRPHIHVGEGNPEGSESAALASAIINWSAFTKLEYGRKWGDWNIARKKTVECSGGGAAWTCILKAQPCKLDALPQRSSPNRSAPVYSTRKRTSR